MHKTCSAFMNQARPLNECIFESFHLNYNSAEHIQYFKVEKLGEYRWAREGKLITVQDKLIIELIMLQVVAELELFHRHKYYRMYLLFI